MQLEEITLDHLKRWTLYTIASILAAIALTYAADLAQAYLRAARGSAFATVQVDSFMVTPLKGGKAEYDYLGQQDVTCTHSLFPQLGHDPCWYVQKHKNNFNLN